LNFQAELVGDAPADFRRLGRDQTGVASVRINIGQGFGGVVHEHRKGLSVERIDGFEIQFSHSGVQSFAENV